MILDSWNNVTLICGNHMSDYTNIMEIKEGPHSLFYSCPKYTSIHAKVQDGKSCNNRLTLVDFEEMLCFLMEKAHENVEETNLKGLRWNKKGVEYEVMEHKDGKFKVIMKNLKAMRK